MSQGKTLSVAEADLHWMGMALALARRGEGQTRPNPPVGAVVVKHGRAIGKGHHARAGGVHAEVAALRQAGVNARGATLYVTLEPCSTAGRTGACTTLILARQLSRVVVAVTDPNPAHRGRGLTLLRRHGVDVTRGVLEGEAKRLVEPFAKWICTKRPFVSLKWGATMDGKIADAQRRARWITGEAARAGVQAMRRRADAIMVGSGTVMQDDPALTCRLNRTEPLYRIVVDSTGQIAEDARILRDENAPATIVATTARCPLRRAEAYAKRGAAVWRLPSAQGRVSLKSLFRRLGRMGLLHVLCEGGSALSESLVRMRLVDEFVLFMAPKFLGGKDAAPMIGGHGWPLHAAPRIRFVNCERVGEDLCIRARPLEM